MITRLFKFTLVLNTLFLFNQSYAQELVSKNPKATLEELYARVNSLILDMTEENKILLRKEADVLATSDKEDHINLAANVYARSLGEPQLAKQTREIIFERFPRGKTARLQAHGAVFGDKSADITALESGYKEWLQKFPPELYDVEDQDIYSISHMYLAERYAKAGLLNQLTESIKLTKSSDYYGETVIRSYQGLDSSQRHILLPELKQVYTKTEEIVKDSTIPDRKASMNNRQFIQTSLLLAQSYIITKDFDQAIQLMEHPSVEKDESYKAMYERALILGEAYMQTNRKADVTKVYENFFVTHGEEEKLIQLAKKHYEKTAEKSEPFETYLFTLLQQKDSELYSKYEKEMIKQKAPDFTLTDINGNTVSLSDYRGKIVILDFWATWCVPCIQSFPGMQAAVNKYANNPDVVFLFINTWQREENYKELVANFLMKNPYTFHVVFDEMKDAPKAAATAYKLPGIPTKVIIDKEGYIRFHSPGSESVIEKLVKELDIKIDLIKQGQ